MDGKTDFLYIKCLLRWNGRLAQRSKKVKLDTCTVPAQVWPRTAQCCSLQTWGSPPEAQYQYLPSQTVLKLMIVSGNHCCLLLSALFEPNIGVIIKESKSNITHQRAYQLMQQIQKKNANKGISVGDFWRLRVKSHKTYTTYKRQTGHLSGQRNNWAN